MDVIIKAEQKLATQYGNTKRMTAQEHSVRVRFDHNLVEQYIPNNKYKRIYPLDPGKGGYAENGDELEEVYQKLGKASDNIWKKQVGTNTKKETNSNMHEKVKRKKGKNKKHLLTSMTSHIVDKTKEREDVEGDDNDEENENE